MWHRTGHPPNICEMPDPSCFEIRAAVPADLDRVLALNEAAVPHLNRLDYQQMRALSDQAAYFRVAVGPDDGEIFAFLIGLTPEANYRSPNFRWFVRNYPNFAYIDRVAVAEGARRNGLASALYDDFESAFSNSVPMLACEVNLRPDNPPSMAFHRRRGFRQAGSQVIENGKKEVAMMVKNLAR
jgi:uncharacterized protein